MAPLRLPRTASTAGRGDCKASHRIAAQQRRLGDPYCEELQLGLLPIVPTQPLRQVAMGSIKTCRTGGLA